MPEYDIGRDASTRPAPAATDTGLETVAKVDSHLGDMSRLSIIDRPLSIGTEVCLRSQAEELLAAEREKVLFLKTAMEIAQTHCGLKDKTIDSLEADNAAKDARINFLERVAKDQETQITAQEVLEAKLAAAEKALEFYADASKWDDGYFKSEDDGTVLRAYPSSVDKDQGDKARAVLGGKPS